MLNILKKWLIQRKWKSVEWMIGLINDINKRSLLWHDEETQNKVKNLLEETDLFSILYRAYLSDEEKEHLAIISGNLDLLVRSFRSEDVEKNLRSKGISLDEIVHELEYLKRVLARVRSINIKAHAPMMESTGERLSDVAIWEPSTLIALQHFHNLFEHKKYCVVGGLAFQILVASWMRKDIAENNFLKKHLRRTHDFDVIFPSGTDFKNEISALKITGETGEYLFEIELERAGVKRPVVTIDVVSSESHTYNEIPMNITTDVKDALNIPRSMYKQSIVESEICNLMFKGMKFIFRTASVESLIIGKCHRGSGKDWYDISLLLFVADKTGKIDEIDLDLIRRNVDNEKFMAMMKSIHHQLEAA